MAQKIILNTITFLFLTFLISNCSGEAGRRNASNQAASTGPIPGVPTVLTIEDANDGSGNDIEDLTLNNGESITLYAITRDAFGDFVENMPVNWSSSTIDGFFSQIAGETTVFTPTGDEEDVVITATHLDFEPDITGVISVKYDVEKYEGLSLWLRASIFLGKLADDENVIAWSDLNGSNKTLIAVGPGQEPNFIADSINGQPSVRFNASNNDALQASFPISELITNSEFTYFIVFNTDAISTDDSDPIANNTLMIDSNSNFGSTLRAGTPLVQSYNFDSTQTIVTKSISLSTTYVFTSYHENGSLYAQLNGDSVASVVSADTSDITGQLSLGGGLGPVNFLNGDIAEVIIYNNSLPAADRLVVQKYLCTKYALTCP